MEELKSTAWEDVKAYQEKEKKEGGKKQKQKKKETIMLARVEFKTAARIACL